MSHSDSLPQNRLDVPDRVDEEEFFSTLDGGKTLVGHKDLEAAVPNKDKPNLEELERYWVNKPYAFVVIYRNRNEQTLEYYAVEPRLSPTEEELVDFFRDKLRPSLDYDRVPADATPKQRAEVVRDETLALMKRYDLITTDTIRSARSLGDRVKNYLADYLKERAEKQAAENEESVDPIPQPRDPDSGELEKLTDRQVEKMLYFLVRDFIRFGKIDAIKHDIKIEDISCDGYNSRVFVYHTEYEQVRTNIQFAEEDLDEFVMKMAQNAGKGISKRQPSVDATLADGSRAQLTLGSEISDKGTNFTIRQFKDVPFTPVDLINWRTFSLDEMVYLWLAIQNGKSAIFGGGTASGKTTSLNAVSLFMPANTKIVSIEDTRELEIPQKNWVASKTRDSFGDKSDSSVDEFDLIEDALRQRPDYIIMGEVRGEEGRDMFQAMNTGHTVYTTFHASDPEQVIRRFITEPINVSKSLFDAVDIINVQESVRVSGRTVRRATKLIEVDEYTARNDAFSIDTVFSWNQETDEFRDPGLATSDLMEDIRRENGWSQSEFRSEWQRRRVVLAYLIVNGLNTYAAVASTLQAYMASPETVLAYIADDELAGRIENLRSMKNVDINVDPEKEELVPRPDPEPSVLDQCKSILGDADSMLEQYDTDGGDINEDAFSVEDLAPDGTESPNEEDENGDGEVESEDSGADSELDESDDAENPALEPGHGFDPDSEEDDLLGLFDGEGDELEDFDDLVGNGDDGEFAAGDGGATGEVLDDEFEEIFGDDVTNTDTDEADSADDAPETGENTSAEETGSDFDTSQSEGDDEDGETSEDDGDVEITETTETDASLEIPDMPDPEEEDEPVDNTESEQPDEPSQGTEPDEVTPEDSDTSDSDDTEEGTDDEKSGGVIQWFSRRF